MQGELRLIVVSGLSGSGKSIALNVLEDVGFNAIDNLPVSLFETFVAELDSHSSEAYQRTAIGIDDYPAERNVLAEGSMKYTF